MEKHHGRLEIRRIWTSPQLSHYVDFPCSAQVARVERITHTISSGKKRAEVVYLITSLSPEKASAKRLLALNRGHWEIENRLHWVRDVTFAEDASQIRTGSGPQMMATLRNVAISLIRLRRKTCGIAQALRDMAARPHLALAMVGL
ncbi:MAG TPA: ISAs1 family transposase [Thermoanaerobaculia bacterium]|nr:ISAs1 family transposase [Thermoanaerobaculia bacterium]